MAPTTASPNLSVIALVIVVVLLAIVLLIIYLQRRARVQAWSGLAAQLGLVCDTGSGPFSQVVVQGDYQGHALTMDTYTHTTGTGKNRNSKTYTQIKMAVNNPADLRMELSKESIFDKVGKRLGAQDIQTGDAEIDKRFIIKGQPEEGVRRLLTSEILRQPLLSAAALELRLEAGEIRYRKPGVERDQQRLRGAFDLVSALATEVERAR